MGQELSPEQVTKALKPILDELWRLDPFDRFDVANALNGALLDAQASIAEAKRSAVRDLRAADWTLQELSDKWGVSRQRILQLEQGADRHTRKGKP